MPPKKRDGQRISWRTWHAACDAAYRAVGPEPANSVHFRVLNEEFHAVTCLEKVPDINPIREHWKTVAAQRLRLPAFDASELQIKLKHEYEFVRHDAARNMLENEILANSVDFERVLAEEYWAAPRLSENAEVSPQTVSPQTPPLAKSGGPAARMRDDDPDSQKFGKWIIRPGEASFDGGKFFDVDGVLRKLLIRLAIANERTVSNNLLKDACGNDLMEDETLRNHVFRLNSNLKQSLSLSTNPVTSVEGGYRLQVSEPQTKNKLPQTKNKRTSNAKRDGR